MTYANIEDKRKNDAENYQRNKEERLKKSREYHNRPEVKAYRKKYHKEYTRRPEVKARHRIANAKYNRKRMSQEDYSQKRKEQYKRWADKPEVKEKLRAYYKLPEVRARHLLRLRMQRRVMPFLMIKDCALALDWYKDKLSAQDNNCAICEARFSPDLNGFDKSVDHCHATNKLRGILCPKCNKALGAFNDSPTLLRRAADYIKYYKSDR
jgi:hypothetical protein